MVNDNYTYCMVLMLCFLMFFSCGETPKTDTVQKAEFSSTVNTKKETPIAQSPSSNSAKKVIIQGKEISVKSGGEFCLDVQVVNFIDVISMQYSTNWDNKHLEYKSVKNFALKDLSSQNFGRAKNEEQTLRLSWYAQDLQGVTLYNGSTIYQVCFKAIGKSGTATAVEFANSPMIAEIANSKMKRMETELKKVKITIE